MPHRRLPLALLAALAFTFAACQTESEAPPAEEPVAQEPVTASEPPAERINLNTATGDDFRTIPGVGDRMVHEFEEYRPYASIAQFRREIGKYVDEEQVAAYEQYVYVPVHIGEADAATLQQLPGVTEAIAEDLIAGRPYATTAAFLDALAQHVTAEQRAEAERYVTSD